MRDIKEAVLIHLDVLNVRVEKNSIKWTCPAGKRALSHAVSAFVLR